MNIDNYIKSVEKHFKKQFADSETEFKYASEEKPPTGLIIDNPQLEYILDRRFLPYGRFYLSFGKKSSGKTSLFYDFAKIFQQNNGLVIWLETENAADKDYAAKQGVDMDKLILQHPGSLEEALHLAEGYIRRLPVEDPDGTTPVLICLDSIAGSTTEYESEQKHTIQDTMPGSHARILSRFYREMEKPLANEKCIFLALNQLKSNVGAFGFSAESQEGMMGGNAPLFSSTYQFKLDKVGEITKKDEYGADRKIGSEHKISVRRNKLGREGKGQEAEIDLYIDGGIDWYSPLVKRLTKSYPKLVAGSKGYATWLTPNTTYFDNSSGQIQEVIIDVEQSYRDHELAQIIASSPQAKEIIRNAFKIPALPTDEEVKEVEKERLTKRKKRKRLADDEIVHAPIVGIQPVTE